MDPRVFLIIGRRGSGKTALAHYFSFQKRLKGAVAIDIDEPQVFQTVLSKLSNSAAHTREIAIPRLARIWEFVIWSAIFREFRDHDPRIKTACVFGNEAGKVSTFIFHALKALLAKFLKAEDELADELESLIASEVIEEGKRAVLEIARKTPIIVGFDTLENYAVHDEAMMRATAALIECAAGFNREHAQNNVHLKLFVMAEVFPHLCEGVVPNTLKYIRDEVYLHWRPKDLMRLISWRFCGYLSHYGIRLSNGSTIDWEDHRDVKLKMWHPFFGEEIVNGRGLCEKTFPYILRHTQLRPRQLIVLCNSIARLSQDGGQFPKFDVSHIRRGVREAERRLAIEVINSYSSVYKNLGSILDALAGLPMTFKAKELDKRAPHTASQWPSGEYSPLRFRHLVAELGIVGRVRSMNLAAGYVEADFEYAGEDRLTLMVNDDCAIHPMFYDKLNIRCDQQIRVYPFPDHEDFREL